MNHDLSDALRRLRKLEEDSKRNIERQLAAFDRSTNRRTQRSIDRSLIRQMRSDWAVTVLKSVAVAVISAAVAVKSIRWTASN